MKTKTQKRIEELEEEIEENRKHPKKLQIVFECDKCGRYVISEIKENKNKYYVPVNCPDCEKKDILSQLFVDYIDLSFLYKAKLQATKQTLKEVGEVIDSWGEEYCPGIALQELKQKISGVQSKEKEQNEQKSNLWRS